MTELQPTAIELRGTKSHKFAVSYKRVIAIIAGLLIITAAAAITGMIAYRASVDPVIIQPANLPPETDDILINN
ncbi:MAG TPA: hypothetical protein GXZ47_09140 [Treponema sp.]|nr:hypothetical protein [Treponema sp.]